MNISIRTEGKTETKNLILAKGIFIYFKNNAEMRKNKEDKFLMVRL